MGVWNRPMVAVPRWFIDAQSSLCTVRSGTWAEPKRSPCNLLLDVGVVGALPHNGTRAVERGGRDLDNV